MRGRLAESLLDEPGKHAASGQSQKVLPQVGAAATNSYPAPLSDTREAQPQWKTGEKKRHAHEEAQHLRGQTMDEYQQQQRQLRQAHIVARLPPRATPSSA